MARELPAGEAIRASQLHQRWSANAARRDRERGLPAFLAYYERHAGCGGKRYAAEGSRALIDKGFTEFGVQRVIASTMVVNVAPRRVMEKAGLRFVRKFHKPWPDFIEGEEEGDVAVGGRGRTGRRDA